MYTQHADKPFSSPASAALLGSRLFPPSKHITGSAPSHLPTSCPFSGALTTCPLSHFSHLPTRPPRTKIPSPVPASPTLARRPFKLWSDCLSHSQLACPAHNDCPPTGSTALRPSTMLNDKRGNPPPCITLSGSFHPDPALCPPVASPRAGPPCPRAQRNALVATCDQGTRRHVSRVTPMHSPIT
jgi:hypothetical protein